MSFASCPLQPTRAPPEDFPRVSSRRSPARSCCLRLLSSLLPAPLPGASLRKGTSRTRVGAGSCRVGSSGGKWAEGQARGPTRPAPPRAGAGKAFAPVLGLLTDGLVQRRAGPLPSNLAGAEGRRPSLRRGIGSETGVGKAADAAPPEQQGSPPHPTPAPAEKRPGGLSSREGRVSSVARSLPTHQAGGALVNHTPRYILGTGVWVGVLQSRWLDEGLKPAPLHAQLLPNSSASSSSPSLCHVRLKGNVGIGICPPTPRLHGVRQTPLVPQHASLPPPNRPFTPFTRFLDICGGAPILHSCFPVTS